MRDHGRLRVLQVIGSMDIGGAEQVVMTLVKGVDRSRYETGVCCTRFLGALGERLRADGVPVVMAAPARRRWRHVTPLLLKQAVRRFQPDVVHTHGTAALLHAGPLGAVGLLPPWIHTFHYGNYPLSSRKQAAGERLLCRAATRLVAVAEPQRQVITTLYRLAPDRIGRVTNGVPDNPFRRDEAVRASVRAEFGFGPSDLVVGCVAVLRTQKGLEFLLDAASIMRAGHPNQRVLIAGGGPLEEDLRARARRLGLGSDAVITGWRHDGQRMLRALDVFVMPSLWEAMPLALLEAMAAELPIVVTDVDDNRRIVEDGACGLLVPPRDAEGLACAVARLLDSPELAARLAARAHQRWLESYSVSSMVAAYESLYEAAAGRMPAGVGEVAHA